MEGFHLLSGQKKSLFYIYRKDYLGAKYKAFTASKHTSGCHHDIGSQCYHFLKDHFSLSLYYCLK